MIPLIGGLLATVWSVFVISIGVKRTHSTTTAPAAIAVVGAILLPVVALVGLRTFVVEAFRIPSGAMIPTLDVGDHLFASKWRAGRSPRRGELIIFLFPRDTSKDFIKRIVGIEGDRIEMVESRLYINDRPIPRCVLGTFRYADAVDGATWQEQQAEAYLERLGGFEYLTLHAADSRRVSAGEESWYVRSGEVFTMGDNRDNSHDSRYWGGVPVGNIRARPFATWWSDGPHGIRWNRIFSDPRRPLVPPSLAPALARCQVEVRRQSQVPARP